MAAVPALILAYEDQVHQISAAGTGSIPVQMMRNLERCETEAQKFFNLAPGTFELFDRFGKIEIPEDLQRALDSSTDECTIEVREYVSYKKIRKLDAIQIEQNERMDSIEASIKKNASIADTALKEKHSELNGYINKVETHIRDELMPIIDELCRDRTQLQKDLRKAEEKLRQINIRELHEMREEFFTLKEEVKAAVKRVDRIDTMWTTEKSRMEEDISRTSFELKELSRYIQGRIDVLVDADADLARNHQVLEQRVKLLADDLVLFREDHEELLTALKGAKDKEEELKDLLTEVRGANGSIVGDCGRLKIRMRSVEVAAMEEWNGFMPGVLYYRYWSRLAKGSDVQLSSDFMLATGRGNLATSGVVINSTEGLAVADGPCKRFGKPGSWASYFEFEVEEIVPAPAGAGGLWAGMSLNSAQEIADHPRNEFDGWLIGGPLKGLICRIGTNGVDKPDAKSLPATWAPGQEATETAFESVKEQVNNLRLANTHKAKGDIKEIDSCWESETLSIGDRVGVLFRPKMSGGARFRIAVNGSVVAQHDFLPTDSPPADVIGFLFPVVRLAGSGKTVRILRDQKPPPEMLAP